MTFHENTYLEWYFSHTLDRPEAINLYSSGVARLNPREFPMVEAEDPWELVERFESALAAWLGIPQEELVFTPGATGGCLLALLALLPSQGQALVEQPMYEPMVRQAGRAGSMRRLRRRFDAGWCLPLSEIEELVDEDTGLVMITEPHNPSGVCSPREDVLALATLAAERGALLFINEVYRGFTDQGSYHGAADNIVIVSSLSKLFGTYAMRLGWLSAREDTIAELKWGRMNMSAPAAPCAGVGLSVMERACELEAEARHLARDGFSVVKGWVENTDGIDWHEPHGVGYGCARLPEGIDDVSFAELLIEQDDVIVIPGTMFDAPGTIRISWLEAGDRLHEGLARVGGRLRELTIDRS